ncbi:MAG: C2 domain-containing protein [Flavobacteriales bacterium]
MKHIACVLLFFAIVLSSSSCRKSKSGAESQASSGGLFRKTLVGVEVTYLRIAQLPRYAPNGEKWDSWALGSREPDVYVKMVQLDSLLFATEVIEDYAFNEPVQFTRGIPFTVRAFTTDIRIEVFDEDGITADDNIGYFTFNLMKYEKKQKVTLSRPDGTLTLEIGLRWMYE